VGKISREGHCSERYLKVVAQCSLLGWTFTSAGNYVYYEYLGGEFTYYFSGVMKSMVVPQCNRCNYFGKGDIEKEVTVMQQLRECQTCTYGGRDGLTSTLITECILRTFYWEIWKWDTDLSTVSSKDRSTCSVHFCRLHDILNDHLKWWGGSGKSSQTMAGLHVRRAVPEKQSLGQGNNNVRGSYNNSEVQWSNFILKYIIGTRSMSLYNVHFKMTSENADILHSRVLTQRDVKIMREGLGSREL